MSPAITLGCSRVAPNWGQVCSSSGSIKQQKLLTADSRVYLQPDRDRLPSCHCGVTTVEEINQKWTIDSIHLICVPAVVAMLICAYSASLHNSYPNPSFPNAYKISNLCTAVDDVAQVRNNHDHFWSWSVEQEKCLSSPAAETQPPQYHMGRPFAYTHRYRPATSNRHNKVPFRVKVLKIPKERLLLQGKAEGVNWYSGLQNFLSWWADWRCAR